METRLDWKYKIINDPPYIVVVVVVVVIAVVIVVFGQISLIYF